MSTITYRDAVRGLTGSSGDLPDLIQGTFPPFLRDCWSRRSGAVRARLHTRMRLRDPRAGRPSPTVGGRGSGSAQWSGRSSSDPQAFMAEVTTWVAATCSLANKNLWTVRALSFMSFSFSTFTIEVDGVPTIAFRAKWYAEAMRLASVTSSGAAMRTVAVSASVLPA